MAACFAATNSGSRLSETSLSRTLHGCFCEQSRSGFIVTRWSPAPRGIGYMQRIGDGAPAACAGKRRGLSVDLRSCAVTRRLPYEFLAMLAHLSGRRGHRPADGLRKPWIHTSQAVFLHSERCDDVKALPPVSCRTSQARLVAFFISSGRFDNGAKDNSGAGRDRTEPSRMQDARIVSWVNSDDAAFKGGPADLREKDGILFS